MSAETVALASDHGGFELKEVLKKDEVADDAFLGGIKFYVKGVEGKVPAGN